MAPIIFRPDVRYRSKLFFIVGLSGALALAATIALGVAIGKDEAGAAGARTGLLVAVLVNAVWLVPVLLLISPYYRSLRYELHDDEVLVRAGVITRSVKHVPFRTVTNLKLKQDPFDRLFGIGTLDVQTAGMSGSQAGAEESLVGLPNYQEVYEQVAGALRRFRGAMAPTQAEAEPAPAEGRLLAAVLDEVRAIRQTLERS
ncbi:MAG: PH domain-containing protein [Anaerolineae bacterium]|nr:PH domain-containing protein [Anaerolineae bacterium]